MLTNSCAPLTQHHDLPLKHAVIWPIIIIAVVGVPRRDLHIRLYKTQYRVYPFGMYIVQCIRECQAAAAIASWPSRLGDCNCAKVAQMPFGINALRFSCQPTPLTCAPSQYINFNSFIKFNCFRQKCKKLPAKCKCVCHIRQPS